tara:strand:+ start:222 stop:476 length:255 start_codon:yes stop_codon:yes gene_type:complete
MIELTENKMLAVKATYEDGKVIPFDNIDLPHGRKNVIITFLDEEEELSDEWKAEIGRRLDSIDNGTAVLHDGKTVIEELRKEFG